jgi:prepilin peptidase CpaA
VVATLLSATIAALLVAAAWRDLAVRRIPDPVSGGVAAASVALRATEGPGAAALSLAAAAALFLVLFAGFARGLLGGGDVKLATAVALGLPPAGVWQFVVATALIGGLLSALYLILIRLRLPRRAPPGRRAALPARVAAAERWRVTRRGPLPYGIAIAAGGLLTGNLLGNLLAMG